MKTPKQTMVTANQQIVDVVNKLKNMHKFRIADHGSKGLPSGGLFFGNGIQYIEPRNKTKTFCKI